MLTKRNAENLLIVAAIMLAVVMGCGGGSEKAKNLKEATEKLNAAADDLAKLPPKEQLISEPYIKGKLVMVRQSPKGSFYVDSFDSGGFGDAYAQTAEEVQTVALLVCQRTQKGTYRTNENPPRELPAYATDCDVTLVDRSIPAVIFKRRFEAKLGEKAGGTTNTQEINAFADQEIRDFLKALPRK